MNNTVTLNKKNSIFISLLGLAIPVVFSEMSGIVMMVTDRYFLSLLGGAYLSAVSVSSFALYALFLVFWGTLCMYTNALVAQYFGAKQLQKCSVVVTQGVILAFIGYAVILILVFFLQDFIFMLGSHEEKIVNLEKEYFAIISKASLFFLLQGVLSSFFIGIGKSKVVFICGLLGTVLNIPLNYILIFGKLGFPWLGVKGSAYATLISSIVTVNMLVVLYLYKNNKDFRVLNSFHLDVTILKRLVKFGLPSAVEKFINMATYNLFVQMITSYSYNISVAVSIAYTCNVILYVPLLGLGEAVVSLVGRSLGDRNKLFAQQVTRAGFKLSVIYFAIVFIPFILFNDNIINLFLHTHNMSNNLDTIVTKMFMYIMIFSFGFESLLIVLDGALRGAGDTRWVMRTTAIIYIVFLLTEYLAIKVFFINYVFSYMGIILLSISLVFVLMNRYRGTKWLNIHMISNNA